MNKLILEIELPTDLSDKDEVSSFLSKQIELAVHTIKNSLIYFKGEGIVTPTVSIRGLSAKKKEVDEEFNKFKTSLLDWVLKYQPKVDVAPQIRVIKELYGFDKPAEHWIKLFEESRAGYPSTTWFTVKHKINQVKDAEPEQSNFTRKEMDETEILSLVERIKRYTEPSKG